jgi:ATP-dependent Lon protease
MSDSETHETRDIRETKDMDAFDEETPQADVPGRDDGAAMPDDEDENNEAGADDGSTMHDTLPILPATNAVLFPGMLLPLIISNETWIKLVDDVSLSEHKMLAVFWRKNQSDDASDTITPDDLGQTGAAGVIARMARRQDGNVQILLQGQERVQIEEIVSQEPYPIARLHSVEESQERTLEIDGLARMVLNIFQEIISVSSNMPDELASAAANLSAPGMLADMVAVNLNLRPEQQQPICDALNIEERMRLVLGYLEREREILQIGQKAQEEMSRTQREYVLRQQLEAIKRELGESDDERAVEVAELREKLHEAELPEEPRREVERELKRLERLPPGSAEHSVVRTYLDWMLGLPWNKSTPDHFDIPHAREVLDADHYDLERIIEYLAVRKLKHDQGEERLRGPILCLIGPPGVGKTSLGQSIARALGREFIRVALGGIRDESEIRGFRRTYVGALPGRIIQSINRVGSNNPVFMLDEVDKLTMGMQGDPASALLELLDPEQNRAFVDRYLDVAFDLSHVLFICTANRSDTIPGPLLDRMEMLELAGYTDAEKLVISHRYLQPRQREEQGLHDQAPAIPDETLRRLIREYTHEAGVRNLERQIGALYRKMATRLTENQELPDQIEPTSLEDLLGPARFRNEKILGDDEVGVVTGLAWTPVGGDVLFVEASVVPGSGKLTLTGHLGDVMRESAQAALTYARSRSDMLGIAQDFAQKHDIHIHVPSGSVPKDGPSAGITMATALISALTRQCTHKNIAMTGEITLRGKVLPIGGVKEKVLAAQRVGVRTVLLPQENEPDLRDVPEEVRNLIAIVLVSHMDEVVARVLYPDGTPGQNSHDDQGAQPGQHQQEHQDGQA